jgi:hypothetical protein
MIPGSYDLHYSILPYTTVWGYGSMGIVAVMTLLLEITYMPSLEGKGRRS